VRAAWQEPHGDRRQELVFIGVNLDEPSLRAQLDACLVG
jgi:G3E family GTPase